MLGIPDEMENRLVKRLTLMLGVLLGAACAGESSQTTQDAETDQVASDAAEDAAGFLDASSLDLQVTDVSVDAGLECTPGTGCFGEPCDSGDDCLSGLCGLHLGDSVCTQTCEVDCPTGWGCAQIVGDGGDPIFICVSRFTHLCRPCTTTADCAADGSENSCLSYGAEGQFCGATCSEEAPCPEGYRCEETASVTGGLSLQCVSEEAVCACSETATNLALTTPCTVDNDFGSCEGVRTCAPEGLTVCSATAPSEEVCNGIDDDCDGLVDEVDCDDGNPCTDDSCVAEEGCVNLPLDNVECLDGDACTQVDRCEAGVCVGDPVLCDDTNPCTDDLCDSTEGCVYTENYASCDDGEPCTFGDTCKLGVCVPGPTLSCDDQNPCTEDSCDPVNGCVFSATDKPCDDGNPCSVGDSCATGVCKGASFIQCDDTNPCTTDSCNPLSGCVYQPHNLPCDDGNLCSVGDFCQAGGCKPGLDEITCDDGNPCTTDVCDSEVGCKFTPNDLACSDGSDCTVEDTCSQGACVGVGALKCDDGNPCTEDLCLPDEGCQHLPSSGSPCSDGDLCTIGDACVEGACIPGSTQNCDDSNPCTDDSCGADGLCVHTPNAQPCDDANACTEGDSCNDSICIGASIVDCDDSNVCTTDSCSPAVGCEYDFNSLACDDGNKCSVNDQCALGACISGSPQSCFDGNPCTNDSCNPLTGCKNTNNESSCDDGLACTENDTCSGGVCFGSWIPGCE